MPDKKIELLEGDVIRFGRIPFKITKMRLDLSQHDDEEEGPGEVMRPIPVEKPALGGDKQVPDQPGVDGDAEGVEEAGMNNEEVKSD